MIEEDTPSRAKLVRHIAYCDRFLEGLDELVSKYDLPNKYDKLRNLVEYQKQIIGDILDGAELDIDPQNLRFDMKTYVSEPHLQNTQKVAIDLSSQTDARKAEIALKEARIDLHQLQGRTEMIVAGISSNILKYLGVLHTKVITDQPETGKSSNSR